MPIPIPNGIALPLALLSVFAAVVVEVDTVSCAVASDLWCWCLRSSSSSARAVQENPITSATSTCIGESGIDTCLSLSLDHAQTTQTPAFLQNQIYKLEGLSVSAECLFPSIFSLALSASALM
jgi:hypothetical protein